jgi:hypothetical protein
MRSENNSTRSVFTHLPHVRLFLSFLMSRKRNVLRRRRPRWDPNLYLLNQMNASTTATQTTTLYTNGTNEVIKVRLRRPTLSIFPGTAANNCYVCIRRVPSGYANPSTLVATAGLTATIDQPDIFGFGVMVLTIGSASDTTDFEPPISWRALHPTMLLYSGDTIVVQVANNAASTNQSLNGYIEFDTSSSF